MRTLARWIFLALTACSATVLAAEAVLFPDYPDPNKAFFRAALQLALDKSGHDYTLSAVVPEMLQGRSIARAMGSGGDLDVLWTMTTPERESLLIPVRLPVDKGLLGWRIAIVRQGAANLLAKVETVQNLRFFTAGQEHDWPDVGILQANGLPVMLVGQYESLFKMLATARFDYFPRGVGEAWSEVDQHPKLGLTVDSHIVLHYPAAEYFFVTPGKPYLAEHIRQGLLRAQADGSFDRLFLSHFEPLLRRARLAERRVLELQNPLFDPAKQPAIDPAWWYQPLASPAKPAAK
ncbi:hypothetical protein [Vogesella oryzae]|uniref:hypothetical protein n=1 Tax=Vogesella oryzae TaxID=1735285 RepID=UPI001582D9FD|nr:hypothetical protein [Vogesella oryzae]